VKLILEAGPLVAFLLVYFSAGIYAATTVLIVTSLLGLLIGRVLAGHFSLTSLITVAISLIFGGLTIALHDPIFIKIKPSIIFAGFAIALVISQFRGERVLIDRMFGRLVPAPETLLRRINAIWAAYFAIHAALNLHGATSYPDATWVIFKVFGFGALTVIFGLGHLPFVWPYLRQSPVLGRYATRPSPAVPEADNAP
jgi:intracellular septation protein